MRETMTRQRERLKESEKQIGKTTILVLEIYPINAIDLLNFK